MVFVASNTFNMGSPNSERERNANEGPQTTVTLSRGFWIGKYEVTQGEYQDVMGSNPSVFPGDPSRPVSSVSWIDATNYCARLTERELAAGRIPFGSKYRLPTEAEWECAARAGTTTRFSYGDDLAYTGLGAHAWFADNAGPTVHPVGKKLPNPRGIFDMEGAMTVPLNEIAAQFESVSGQKVMRGGAYDFSAADCRSARRNSFGVSPFLTDSDLGFRVVLVVGTP